MSADRPVDPVDIAAPVLCRKKAAQLSEAMQWDGSAQQAMAIVVWALGTDEHGYTMVAAGASLTSFLRVGGLYLRWNDVLVKDPDGSLVRYRSDTFADTFDVEESADA